MKEHDLPINFMPTNNLLRYEHSEQHRGQGLISVDPHSFTPQCYERIDAASKAIIEGLSANTKEWNFRFALVRQWLGALDELYLKPNGKSDPNVSYVISQFQPIDVSPDPTTAANQAMEARKMTLELNGISVTST